MAPETDSTPAIPAGEVIPRCLSSTYINLNTYIDNLYKFKSYRTKVIVVCQNSMTQMEMSFILFLVNNLIIKLVYKT